MLNEKEIDFIPVFEEKIKLVVPKGHPLTKKEDVTLKETLNYKHIIFRSGSGFRNFMDGLFKQLGKFPEAGYEVEEDSAMAGLVAQGFGIAIMPNIPILNTMDVDTVLIREPKMKCYIYLAKMKNKYLSPVAQEFVKYVIANRNL